MNTTDKIMAHVQHACATFKPSSLRVHDDVMASIRAEIEALVDSNAAKADRIDRLGEMVEKLKAENEALVRDAERYRFIRDACRSECIEYEIRTYSMETLDEYVDAAIEDEAAMQEKQS